MITAGLLMAFTHPASSKVMPLSKVHADTSWHLIFEDAKAKVFYTDEVCDNSNVLRLRFVNLSDSAFRASYKVFDSGTFKEVALFAHQELEGLCSEEYKTVLMETVPAGLTVADIKVSLTYLP